MWPEATVLASMIVAEFRRNAGWEQGVGHAQRAVAQCELIAADGSANFRYMARVQWHRFAMTAAWRVVRFFLKGFSTKKLKLNAMMTCFVNYDFSPKKKVKNDVTESGFSIVELEPQAPVSKGTEESRGWPSAA